jgi:putative ABC transport system permease protein
MLALLKLVSLRHLVGSPLRTLITIAGVAIGVATLVGIAAINRSVMEAFRSTIDTVAGKAELTVAAESTGMPEELLETVRAVPGVAHASGSITIVAPVNDSHENLYVMGVDLLDDGFFRTYEGVDADVGKLGDDLEFLNSTDRLLLSERYAKDHHLKTGDTIELVTPDGVRTFTIHALLKETGPLKAFGGSVAVMFFGSLQEAFSRGRTLTRIDVASTDKHEVDALKARLQAAVGPTMEVDAPDRRGQAVETMVRSFQLGLNLGSGVALLVGVFLVYNTVSIGVVQRRREIGTLRALGASRGRIRSLFTLEAGVLGLVGAIVGMPLGLLVARGAIAGVSESVSAIYIRVNVKDVQLGPNELLLGLALGVLGSVLAALRPAWVASSVQPVEALRRDVAAGAGAVKLRSWPTYLGVALFLSAWPATLIPPPVENFSLGGYLSVFLMLMGMTLLAPLLLRALNRPFQRPGEWLFGIAGRLAADNFARAPVRTAVPVSALSIGVAMAICLAGFVGSFQASTDRWIDQSIPADLFVTSAAKLAGSQNQQMNPSLARELDGIDGITDVDAVRIMPFELMKLRIFIISLSAPIYEKRGAPIIVEGHVPTAAERAQGYVLVSENLARRRDLHVGSSFPINTPTGTQTWHVGGVIIDYTSDQGSIIMDHGVFSAAFNDTRVDTFHVYVADRARDTERVRAAITERVGRKYDVFVLSNAELRTEAKNLVASAFALTYAMEFVAVVLALLGVINTLLAAVLDRTREIGLMRAIGADRGHIVKLFAGEAFFIGLTGGAMGLTVGSVIAWVVTKVVGVQGTGWDFPFVFPTSTAIQMLVASTACAILAGLYPARRAASLDVVEALAYE